MRPWSGHAQTFMTPRHGSPTAHQIAVAAITALGLVMRAWPTLGSPLPLNDGGLFVTMADDLRSAGFLLPRFTTYNLDQLPFAYPPAGIYLLGIVSAVTGMSAISLEQLFPIAFSTATIPLAYLLARRLLGSPWLALAAAAAFALMPRSFEWLVVGGGVTRAPGLLLGMAAMLLSIRAADSGSPRWAGGAGLLLGLSAVTHPEAAVFATASIVLLVMSIHRSLRAAATVLTIGVIAAAVAAPWVLAVVAAHGPDPFLTARGSRAGIGDLLLGLSFQFTGAEFLPVFGLLGGAGLVMELLRGRYLLPAWLALAFVATPAAGATFAMLPWAMLVGRMASHVQLPLSSRARALAAAVLAAAVVSAYLAPLSGISPLHGTSADELAAMAWVREETAPSDRFLIVSGVAWQNDRASEWFPTLTERHSVGTVQGYEWTTADRWREREARHEAIRRCSTQTSRCLSELALDFDYLYLPKGPRLGFLSASDCCPVLRSTLSEGGYAVVYDGPGATIATAR